MSSKKSEKTPQQSNENSPVEGNRTDDSVHSQVPVETYRGEARRTQVVDKGDLEEETLDSDAPFNKTYGREKPTT